MNKIYCSTGVMVGRINNNDYTLIGKYFPDLINDGLICGGEFMFAHSFYNKLDEIHNYLSNYNIPFDILHCDKEIGVMLSECDDKIAKEALRLLDINCSFAKKIGAKMGVFHLWGGIKSDSHIEYNLSFLPKIVDIFRKYNIQILIENIPCTSSSGLSVWKKLYKFLPDIAFIFDTRFGAFHGEMEETFNEPIWEHIKHIHISDYSSYPRNFEKIRPILHPGEGVIDFDFVFKRLKELNYNGSFTLESPVFAEKMPNIKKLKNTLAYIKDHVLSHD